MPNPDPNATRLQKLDYDEANRQLYDVPVKFPDGTLATADLSGQLNEFAEVRVWIHETHLTTRVSWRRIEEMLDTDGQIVL